MAEPLPPLVTRLTAELGYPMIDPATASLPAETGGEWLIFLPGHGQKHLETADIAIILPELLAAFRGRLKAAVADAALEKSLRQQLDGIPLPALVVVRGHELLGAIPRVLDWHEYLDTITTMIDGKPAAAVLQ